MMQRDERASYCPLCGLLAPNENPHQECIDQEQAYVDSWQDEGEILGDYYEQAWPEMPEDSGEYAG